MKCIDFEERLKKASVSPLEESERAQMLQHEIVCADCAESAAVHADYIERLSHFKEPELGGELKSRLLSMAEHKRASTRRPTHVSVAFASGFIAASVLALATVIGLKFYQQHSEPDWESLFAQEALLIRDVTLVIEVPQDMPDASLMLSLPSEINISGYGELAEVTWPVSLKKGVNKIVLPVQLEPFAMFSDRIVLAGSLVYKSKKKEFSLDIDLDTPSLIEEELIQGMDVFSKDTHV